MVREGGGSADGFHLAINKHASHLRTQGCQSPDPSSPFSRGQAKQQLKWGCLGTGVGSFQGFLPPHKWWEFSESGKGRSGQEENEVLWSIASRKPVRIWAQKVLSAKQLRRRGQRMQRL